MNEAVEQVTPEQVAETADQPQADQPRSIAEHAAQFGPQAKAQEPAEEPEVKTHPSAAQKRDKDTGQWKEGKVRHRAKSQQASPEDVPRIRELTGKLRAAEEELARLRAQQAPPRQIAKAEAKVEQAGGDASDPEPKEDDPKYGGDYGKYLRDLARWEGRQAVRQEREAETKRQETTRKQEAAQAQLRTWAERVASAREKYEDFDTVALGPTIIPRDSLLDAFIMEDDTGPDVLYYLQAHRQELEDLLAKPALQQVKALALLSQRFSSSTPPAQAGTTGSAAGRQVIVLPPRPPNPVRTEAQRAGDRPPPTDGSLSIAEHAKAFGPKRR